METKATRLIQKRSSLSHKRDVSVEPGLLKFLSQETINQSLKSPYFLQNCGMNCPID